MLVAFATLAAVSWAERETTTATFQWFAAFSMAVACALAFARLSHSAAQYVIPLASALCGISLLEFTAACFSAEFIEAGDAARVSFGQTNFHMVVSSNLALASIVGSIALSARGRSKSESTQTTGLLWLPSVCLVGTLIFLWLKSPAMGMRSDPLTVGVVHAGSGIALLAALHWAWKAKLQARYPVDLFYLFVLIISASLVISWTGTPFGNSDFLPALRGLGYLALAAALIRQVNLDLGFAEIRAQNLFLVNEEVQQQIEERKWTEELLAETRLFAESIVETIREPLLVLDSELRVIRANRPFYQTFQLTSEGTLNRFLGDVGNGQWRRQGLLRQFRKLVEQDKPFENYELTADFRGVGVKTVLLSGRFIDKKDLRTNLILLAMYDITEQKAAEEEARRLARGVESAADAIIMTDVDGSILYTNPAMSRLTGFEPSELIGQKPSIFKSGNHDDSYYGEMWATILRGEVWSGEVTNKKRNGDRYEALLTIAPVFDQNGRKEAFVSVQSDITELKRAKEELGLRAAELARSNAELEQFAYIASHDLQEPLRMVSSYCQLLQRRYQDKLDQNANDFIGYAVDGAFRMQKLIHDLLAYCRVGTKGQPLDKIDCSASVNRALENLQVSIAECDARIRVDKLPVTVADDTELVQLFQNLIGNALKFRKSEGPQISISSRRKNGDWVFLVKDNGIGIEAAFAERIFDIFQRLHANETYPGTGIGLALCKKIVERHGGRIWVESKPGKGSTFKFTLPGIEEVRL